MAANNDGFVGRMFPEPLDSMAAGAYISIQRAL